MRPGRRGTLRRGPRRASPESPAVQSRAEPLARMLPSRAYVGVPPACQARVVAIPSGASPGAVDGSHDRGAGAVGHLARPGNRAAVEVQGGVGVGQYRDDGDACRHADPSRPCGRSRRRTDGPPAGRRSGRRRDPAAPGPIPGSGGRAAGCGRRCRPRWRALRSAATPATRPRCPPRCPRASAPAAVAASRACLILGAENMGSSDRPVLERTWAAACGCLSARSAHQAAVRASCHPSTGPSGRPLDRSQQTTDSRWFEIDTPDEGRLRSTGQALLGRRERGTPQLVRVLLDHAAGRES